MQTNICQVELRGILSHGNSYLLSNHLPFHEHHFSPIPNQTLSVRRFIALVRDTRLPPKRSAYVCACGHLYDFSCNKSRGAEVFALGPRLPETPRGEMATVLSPRSLLFPDALRVRGG